MAHYQIELVEILPGFWTGKTLFPLYLVAYNHLPMELPYSALKLFIKSGKPIQKIFRTLIESEKRSEWVQAFLTAMEMLHPNDAKEVLDKVTLAAKRKALQQTMLEIVKDDVDKQVAKQARKAKSEGKAEGLAEGELKTKREMAQQMKADGMPMDRICKYTGLSAKEVKQL